MNRGNSIADADDPGTPDECVSIFTPPDKVYNETGSKLINVAFRCFCLGGCAEQYRAKFLGLLHRHGESSEEYPRLVAPPWMRPAETILRELLNLNHGLLAVGQHHKLPLAEDVAHAADLGTDAAEFFFDALIAAVDVVDAVEDGFSIRDQRGED